MPAPVSDDAVPPCGSDDLAVTVSWDRDGAGLRGQVIAENVSGRACRLAGKPQVQPLRPDGTLLRVDTVITLEMRTPGYVILPPGERAAARVSWASWCGPRASGRAQVTWDGGSAVAEVRGPAQPECVQGQSGNLTSSWFDLLR
jgi:hypothetical protein